MVMSDELGVTPLGTAAVSTWLPDEGGAESGGSTVSHMSPTPSPLSRGVCSAGLLLSGDSDTEPGGEATKMSTKPSSSRSVGSSFAVAVLSTTWVRVV